MTRRVQGRVLEPSRVGAGAFGRGASTVPPITDLAHFGDSYDHGDVTASASTRYTRIAANALGIGASEAANNYSIGGARQNLNLVSGTNQDILTQIYQARTVPSSAPYAPVFQVATLHVSFNNLNLNAVRADLSIVVNAVVRGIHAIRAAGRYEALNAGRWAYTGSTSTVLDTAANTGTGVKRFAANGSTGTLTTPTDFPGGIIRPYGPKANGFGAVETFTLDGSAAGSVSNKDAALASGSQCWQHAITTPAGAHTIGTTVSSISSVENINGADFWIPAKVPLVVVIGACKAIVYPGGERSIVDSDIDDVNAAVIAGLASAFPSDPQVVWFDLDGLVAKNTAYFTGGDNIHLNVAGHAAAGAGLGSTIASAPRLI